MMEFQRLILYVALGLVLLMLWQSWLEFTNPTLPAPGQDTVQPGGERRPALQQADDGTVPEAPPAAPVVAGDSQPAPAEAPDTGRVVTIKTDLLRVDLSAVGADVRGVDLLQYPIEVDAPDQPLRLMTSMPPNLFYTESGLLGRGHELPNHKTAYTVEPGPRRLGGDEFLEVAFRWTSPSQVRYRKVYRFQRDSYEIGVRYEIDNAAAADWTGYQYAQFVRTEARDDGNALGFLGRLPSYEGGAIYTPEEKFEKIDFDDMADADLAHAAIEGWVAMLEHYFVGAWLPREEGSYEFYSSVADTDSRAAPVYRIGFKTLEPVTVAAGANGTLHNRLFIGPKEQDRLETAAGGLKLTVDYGWLTIISSPLFELLNWLHKLAGNWGWSIILLTVLIKLVFFPLSAASYKSMARMKNVQPRLKTLKERYGDDRQKFQQEMMKIYKEEKINPLGGCLPILIQIPVFIALYWVLLESVELRQAQWFWLKDLSAQDPFYILPLLMGASMVVQQRLNPAPMDDLQKKIMMALPVVFTVFFLFFPSGLVLYWVVNNILSIAQQWVITRKISPS